MTALLPSQEFVYVRTYSRWMEDEKRRERWDETVARYFKFMRERFSYLPEKMFRKSQKAVMEMSVMPSMRALWAAGPALASNSITGYNCCSMVFKDLFAPAELFYILMCGTGVGFSVEDQYIRQMPVVERQRGEGVGVHVVADDKEGWATALYQGLLTWFAGKDIEFDFTKVRPRGSRLKTMGGRASGPGPLKRLLEFVRTTVLGAQGRKLTSVEWLDIGNMIGDVVVVGGVRRSSEITFSDLNDEGMRDAKDFTKGAVPVWRQMSNNSVAYTKKPTMVEFMREWTALAASGSGERGIFNVEAAMHACERRAKKDPRFLERWGFATWEDLARHLRTNPCGEILLLAILGQFCNLTEVVVREDDTIVTLIEKVKTAVWLGAMQACLTDFPFIRPSFKAACEEERLLGVSLTGQFDNRDVLTEDNLKALHGVAVAEARKATKALGVNMSAAITTGKPSGTVSQLVNSASGAHPRFSKWQIRRYRINGADPLFRMMRDQGVPFSPENGQGPEEVESRRAHLMSLGRDAEEVKILVPDWSPDQVQTWVVEFPLAAPKRAVCRNDVSAIDQLEWYLRLKRNWCEHNQSMSIYVRDDEWMKVGSWVYDHFDEIGGLSFFPYDNGGGYKQLPNEEITEEEYHRRIKAFPKIDYQQLAKYEIEDNTTGAQQLACSASGGCDA